MNIATICYVSKWDLAERSFVKHLAKFTSKEIPVHLLTDTDPDTWPKDCPFPIHTVRKIGPFPPREYIKHVYAFWAFVRIAEFAVKLGVSHFIYLEVDCRFGSKQWDTTMVEEFLKYPEAVYGGTIMIWHPWCKGMDISKRIIEYAYEYQKRSCMPLDFWGEFSGDLGWCMYTNGALTLHTTEECRKAFEYPIAILDNVDAETADTLAIRKYKALDIGYGYHMWNTYKEDIFKRSLSMACVYSGCFNIHTSVQQRVDMLRSGSKVAVHHLKIEEAAYEE